MVLVQPHAQCCTGQKWDTEVASPLPVVAEAKEAGPGEQEQRAVRIVSIHFLIRQGREAWGSV